MPAAKNIRAIIFDIGRVLVRLDIAGAMRGLAVSLSAEETWSAIEHDPRWRDWQEGRISPRDWQLHICRRLGVEMSFEKFSDVWNRVLDPAPQSVLWPNTTRRRLVPRSPATPVAA